MENTQQTVNPGNAAGERIPNTPRGIVCARAAFLRDLPQLLAEPKYDRWSVAYCGDERIGLAESEMELIQECKRRGLKRDEYYIGCIFPHADEEEEIEAGLSFVEYDDDETAAETT